MFTLTLFLIHLITCLPPTSAYDYNNYQTPGKWGPLRMDWHFRPSPSHHLSLDQRRNIHKGMNEVQDILRKFLKVQQNTGLLFNSKRGRSLSCLGHPVPLEHQNLKNIDLMIYVTTDSKRESCGPHVAQAYAMECLGEARQNYQSSHPIAGLMTVCIHTLRSENPYSNIANTLLHEALHIVGVHEYGIKKVSTADVIQDVNIRWKHIRTDGSPTWSNKRVSLVTTPNVQRYVRNYFSCPRALGAQLEDQGGAGVRNQHWDGQIFGDEVMSGSGAPGHITGVTLALLLDMGWYRKGDGADELLSKEAFGKGKGCDFLFKSCLEYIQLMQARNMSPQPYCSPDDFMSKSSYYTGRSRCNNARTAIHTCDVHKLGAANKPKDPRNYYYPGYTTYSNSRANCPTMTKQQGFVFPPNGGVGIPYDNGCLKPQNRTWDLFHTLENFGKDSRCFETSMEPKKIFNQKYCIQGSVYYSSPLEQMARGAGCFRHRCRDGSLQVQPSGEGANKNKWLTCNGEGSELYVSRNTITTHRTGVIAGVIICPKCSDLCSSCTNSNTKGSSRDAPASCDSNKRDHGSVYGGNGKAEYGGRTEYEDKTRTKGTSGSLGTNRYGGKGGYGSVNTGNNGYGGYEGGVKTKYGNLERYGPAGIPGSTGTHGYTSIPHDSIYNLFLKLGGIPGYRNIPSHDVASWNPPGPRTSPGYGGVQTGGNDRWSNGISRNSLNYGNGRRSGSTGVRNGFVPGIHGQRYGHYGSERYPYNEEEFRRAHGSIPGSAGISNGVMPGVRGYGRRGYVGSAGYPWHGSMTATNGMYLNRGNLKYGNIPMYGHGVRPMPRYGYMPAR